jgi:hypothetical protein
MKLLTVSADAKTVKGQKFGYLTGILYLAPAHESGVMNTCPMASDGCKAGCLFTAGRASIFPAIIEARIRKTHELHNDREAFMEQLRKDVRALVRKAKRDGLTPAVRINGTSDLPQLAIQLANEFGDVQFYDYTKIPMPWRRIGSNYHLTFSLNESNMPAAMEALQHGVNVAVVFDVKKGHALPETWQGYRVIDGDVSDLRFLDKKTRKDGMRAVIVGLRAKGEAKKDVLGFVQIAAQGAI